MIPMSVLYVAIAVVAVVSLVSRHLLRHEPDPVTKTLNTFRVNLVLVGGFCVLLWFLLPITPVLSTFGYPDSTRDIQSTELLLGYLQEYNRALVRTTQVLHWFIFVFVWWFLTTLFDLSKTLAKKREDGNLVSAQSYGT